MTVLMLRINAAKDVDIEVIIDAKTSTSTLGLISINTFDKVDNLHKLLLIFVK